MVILGVRVSCQKPSPWPELRDPRLNGLFQKQVLLRTKNRNTLPSILDARHSGVLDRGGKESRTL